MTVFERIEMLRKNRGISQGKLEKELGFSNGSISKWRNSMPNSDRLKKIADYFGVSVEYIMTGEEKSFTNNISADTIAAHFDGNEYTEEELVKIKEFADFVKSQRKQS